jgi:hypothetical protein
MDQDPSTPLVPLTTHTIWQGRGTGTSSSRSHLGEHSTFSWCGCHLLQWSVGVRGRPSLFVGVVTQLDTHEAVPAGVEPDHSSGSSSSSGHSTSRSVY